MLHGAPINANHESQNKQRAEKKKKNGLSFGTTTGQIDDLKMNQQEKSVRQNSGKEQASEAAITPLHVIDPSVNHKNSLKAVIDQKAKFRSGDKIQMRILENNFYNDVPIYKNIRFQKIGYLSKSLPST